MLTPEEAITAMKIGLSRAGLSMFDMVVARSPRLFGDVVFTAVCSTVDGLTFERTDDLRFTVRRGEAGAKDAVTGDIKLHRFYNALHGIDIAQCYVHTARTISDCVGMCHRILGETGPKQGSAENIVPLLKMRDQVDRNNADIAQLPEEKRHPLLFWGLADSVIAMPTFDMPDQFQFITTQSLASLQMTEQQVRETAMANMLRMVMETGLGDLDEPLVPSGSGFGALDGVGGITSSIVMADAFWKKQVELTGCSLYLVCEGTDRLIVARQDDRQTALALRAMLMVKEIASILPNTVFIHGRDGLSTATFEDFVL